MTLPSLTIKWLFSHLDTNLGVFTIFATFSQDGEAISKEFSKDRKSPEELPLSFPTMSERWPIIHLLERAPCIALSRKHATLANRIVMDNFSLRLASFLLDGNGIDALGIGVIHRRKHLGSGFGLRRLNFKQHEVGRLRASVISKSIVPLSAPHLGVHELTAFCPWMEVEFDLNQRRSKTRMSLFKLGCSGLGHIPWILHAKLGFGFSVENQCPETRSLSSATSDRCWGGRACTTFSYNSFVLD
ncbi:hypothetical protein Tco_1028237 [Tanacetum coccineum]|uniref:Maturase n=1 Tax=Tanacetum coccineum TaxID=301880 RepID=A0ABQ5G095_9ASTR